MKVSHFKTQLQVQNAFLLLYWVQNCNPPLTFTFVHSFLHVYMSKLNSGVTHPKREKALEDQETHLQASDQTQTDHAAPPPSTCRWVLPCFLSFLSSSSSPLLFHFRPLLLLHSQTQARTQLTFFNHIFLGGGGLCLSLVVVAGGWLEPCNCKWVMARRLYSRLFHFHLQQPSVSPRSHSDNYTRARAHIYMLS